MIIEDYCSFEVAKMLKEKGFDEPCLHYYRTEIVLGKECTHFTFTDEYFHNSEVEYGAYKGCKCTAPTLQMAMKWLREKGIYITIVYGDYPSLNKVFWTPQIDSLKGFNLPDSFYKEYDKYEEAVEAALKYCLENLI